MNAENECTQAVLERYLDDDLGRDERTRTERHLKDCPDCQQHLAALRLSADLLCEHLENASAAADFAGFEDRVLSAVGSQTDLGISERIGLWLRESFTHHKRAWVVSTAGLAVLVLMLALLPMLRGEPTGTAPIPGPDPVPHLAQVDNETIIDSMEYAGERSMIFTVSKNNTTVIWMYDYDGPGALDSQGDEI